jgi:hypothetical protein
MEQTNIKILSVKLKEKGDKGIIIGLKESAKANSI